jgi:RNA polymerase sigma-70 factor (ECF subfamily)
MSRERTDADLLRAARRSPDAFCQVYDRHAQRLYGWLRGQGVGPDDATDLVAETFAQAWRSRSRFRDERDGSALPWLHGIATNLLRRSWERERLETTARRKLGIRLDAGHSGGFEEAEERIATESATGDLLAALDEVHPDDRSMVIDRVVHDAGYEELAATYGITEPNARMRISRTLRRLNSRLEGANT